MQNECRPCDYRVIGEGAIRKLDAQTEFCILKSNDQCLRFPLMFDPGGRKA